MPFRSIGRRSVIPITIDGAERLESTTPVAAKPLDASLCQTLDTFFGGEIAIFHNEHFNEFASELPIIARNKLEYGISKTLWYEEFVPRQTCFLVTFGLEDDVEPNHVQTFKELLKNNCYQIGANATVGYGRCLFTDVRDA